jgi:hypothetical protein
MRNRLRQALARYWSGLFGRDGTGRGVLRRIAARKAENEERGRSAEARARFWAELRDGQREAEAQCSRLHP